MNKNTSGAIWEGSYFQVGKSFQLVNIAIKDSSVLSTDLRTSVQSRLAGLAHGLNLEVRTIERETVEEFSQWMTAEEIKAEG